MNSILALLYCELGEGWRQKNVLNLQWRSQVLLFTVMYCLYGPLYHYSIIFMHDSYMPIFFNMLYTCFSCFLYLAKIPLVIFICCNFSLFILLARPFCLFGYSYFFNKLYTSVLLHIFCHLIFTKILQSGFTLNPPPFFFFFFVHRLLYWILGWQERPVLN